MNRMRFHVCPVCGNIILSTGEAVISCCGIALPALEAEEPDPGHELRIERSEDEHYVRSEHEMDRGHFVSFIAGVGDGGCELKKLYPEGPCEARFRIGRTARIYWFCNRHGMFTAGTPRKPGRRLFADTAGEKQIP